MKTGDIHRFNANTLVIKLEYQVKVKAKTRYTFLLMLAINALPAIADTTQARCEIRSMDKQLVNAAMPCAFSQRQGYIRISRDDGISYALAPTGDSPGNYTDEDGRPAYRKRGLGEEGLIFQLSDELVYVYWNTSGLNP
jgi:hypothetical protein